MRYLLFLCLVLTACGTCNGYCQTAFSDATPVESNGTWTLTGKGVEATLQVRDNLTTRILITGPQKTTLYDQPLDFSDAIGRIKNNRLRNPALELSEEPPGKLLKKLTLFRGMRFCDRAQNWCVNEKRQSLPFVIAYYDMNGNGNIDLEHFNANPSGPYDSLNWMVDGREKNMSYGIPFLNSIIDWDTRGGLLKIKHIVEPRVDEGIFYGLYGRAFEEGELRHGFEYPFAFHDLAEDKDGIAELYVRMVDENVRDAGEERAGITTYEEVRYTWDQNNDGNADYRIHYLGKNPYTQEIQLPEYRVRSLGFNETKTWAFEQNWSSINFASNEYDVRISEEGIYEHGKYLSYLREKVLRNSTIKLPEYLPLLVGVWEDNRISPHQDLKAQLYIHPIDRRVHLFRAQESRILISAKKDESDELGEYSDFTRAEFDTIHATVFEEIKAYDTDTDGILDLWKHIVNGSVAEEVYWKNNSLIVNGERLDLLPKNMEWLTIPNNLTAYHQFGRREDITKPRLQNLSAWLEFHAKEQRSNPAGTIRAGAKV